MIFNKEIFGNCLRNDNMYHRDATRQRRFGMGACIAVIDVTLRVGLQKHESMNFKYNSVKKISGKCLRNDNAHLRVLTGVVTYCNGDVKCRGHF